MRQHEIELLQRRRAIEGHLSLIRARHPEETRQEIEEALSERLEMLKFEEATA